MYFPFYFSVNEEYSTHYVLHLCLNGELHIMMLDDIVIVMCLYLLITLVDLFIWKYHFIPDRFYPCCFNWSNCTIFSICFSSQLTRSDELDKIRGRAHILFPHIFSPKIGSFMIFILTKSFLIFLLNDLADDNNNIPYLLFFIVCSCSIQFLLYYRLTR